MKPFQAGDEVSAVMKAARGPRDMRNGELSFVDPCI